MQPKPEFLKCTPAARAHFYTAAFPDRPPLAIHSIPGQPQWVAGTWLIGACYKNPNPLYGAYPHGYLERVHAMFPDAKQVLHVFSGGLTLGNALKAAGMRRVLDDTGRIVNEIPTVDAVELVDLKGPEDGRHPTWQGDIMDMPAEWAGRFDLILADPPYSSEDAEKYGTPMVNRGKIIARLRDVAQKGGNLVWLDQVWPMHRKNQWRTWAHIGLVRSTNHRMRLVSMFEAV
jgi:16S rRNA G966 N2-methylase RsmD